MSNPERYPVDVFYSEEDQGYIALARDLPGCSAFGETRAEAAAEIQDAIVAWIEASEKAGNVVPEPSKETEDALPSGKILLRLPRSLHGQLVERARREGTSLNQLLLYLVSSSASAHEVAVAVTNEVAAVVQQFSVVRQANVVSQQVTAVSAAHKYAGLFSSDWANQLEQTTGAVEVVVLGAATHPREHIMKAQGGFFQLRGASTHG